MITRRHRFTRTQLVQISPLHPFLLVIAAWALCRWLTSGRFGDALVAIRDDGVGGAVLTPGGGLAGLRDRVEALDGSLTLSSPAGGPTVVRVVLPVV